MTDWPLHDLALRTPRLELRPDDDDGLRELIEEAHRGIHPPAEMPFLVPWTDADPRYLGRGILQYHWAERARLAPENWSLHFLVRHDGRVVGMQSLHGVDFGVTRQVRSGSWIGLRHQRRGIGTEMRAAVLTFAFDHLRATTARSSAFADNAASQEVSRKLGYRRDGTATVVRRGAAAQDVRLVLDVATFVRPPWTLAADGVEGCLGLLGAA